MDTLPPGLPHVKIINHLKSQSPDLLCKLCRISMAMEGFRIVCDLSVFFGGIRKRSFLYIDIENLTTIQDLCFRIRESFNIKECVALMIDDVFLPFLEHIKVLRADDVVKVVLLDANSDNTRINASIKPATSQQNVESNLQQSDFVNVDGIPQIVKEIIHTRGGTTEIVNGSVNDTLFKNDALGPMIKGSTSTRKRKRKKHRSAGVYSEDNPFPVLTEIISDNSEVMVLEIPHEKKKRKSKNVDNKPDEDNVDQALTGTTSEIVPDMIRLSSAEIPTGESIAVISNATPETTSVPKKRKRLRTRKKKVITSDIPAESCTQRNYSNQPALNPYAKAYQTAYVNQVDPNLSHLRFSSSPSNEVENDLLDYNPLEDDLVVPSDGSRQVNSTTEENGEINGIKGSNTNIIASGSGAPLVVRRRSKIDAIQPFEGEKVRKFLQKPPEINDIITFKIWKMDQNYCPEISGLIKAKVLNFCNDSQQLRFFILDGKAHCEQPNGKFSLDVDFSDDGPPVPPIIPDIMELNWQEMLEVEIFL